MSALEHPVSVTGGAVEASAAELFQRHRRRLVAFCYSQLGGRDEADDAVQDTFIYALHALRRGVVPDCEVAWLFTIARNVCHTRRRNGSRHNRVLVTRDLHALGDVLPARDQTAEELYGLEEALASIPDTQRHAILLREWRGLSYREIARELELSQAAVETLLFRARRSLSRALDRSGATAARALNLPGLVGLARSLVGGSVAKLGAAAAVTVAATSTIGVTALHERGVHTPHHARQPSIEAFAWRPDALTLLDERQFPLRTQTGPTLQVLPSHRPAAKRVERDVPRRSVHDGAAVAAENENVAVAPPSTAVTRTSEPTTTAHVSGEPARAREVSLPAAPAPAPPPSPSPPPLPAPVSVPAAEPPAVSASVSPNDVQVQASATLPPTPVTPDETVAVSISAAPSLPSLP